MCAAMALSPHTPYNFESDLGIQELMKPTIVEHHPFDLATFKVAICESTKATRRPLCRKKIIEAVTDPLLNSPFPFIPVKCEKTEEDIASEIEDALSSTFSSTSSLILEPQEKKVIVHRISDTETLAGIALLYGVTLDELKRINKLWSDNLHLRQTLYIPLEMVNYQEIYLRFKSLELQKSESRSTNGAWTDASLSTIKSPLIEIISIPETELKFFSTCQNDPQVTMTSPAELIQEDLPSLKEIFKVTKLAKLVKKLRNHKKHQAFPTNERISLEVRDGMKMGNY